MKAEVNVVNKNYLPPFMAGYSECERSEAIPVEGVHYAYDPDGQTAIPMECMSRPTGYATQMGNDWVTTDHTLIEPPGPNGPN
jgi:hypothetical protein